MLKPNKTSSNEQDKSYNVLLQPPNPQNVVIIYQVIGEKSEIGSDSGRTKANKTTKRYFLPADASLIFDISDVGSALYRDWGIDDEAVRTQISFKNK